MSGPGGLTVLPAPLAPLHELAHNLWWASHPPAVALFREIDPHRWERHHHNPVALLADIGPAQLASLAADGPFLDRLASVYAAFRAFLDAPTWHATNVPNGPKIAYFSMEFGLHESLRTYSGGLGVLAGDHLKSASDLGVPLVGVTLFYRHGYFRQVIDDGRQLAAYPVNDPARLPIQPCLRADGRPVEIEVPLGEQIAHVRAWRLDVGRAGLLLLDTDHEANPAPIRALCHALYGGDEHMRIAQEVILGIGGVRILRALSLEADVYHMNEGHCAFVALELLREHTAQGLKLAAALDEVRAACVFTTHTPVPAGHDRFPPALVQRTLGPYEAAAGWPAGTITDLGRVHPGDPNEMLCMTVVALKASHATNGVARKHGEVSRAMWTALWPGQPVHTVPIGHVTNGVHPTTWMSARAQALFDQHVPAWRSAPWDPGVWKAGLDRAPDDALWSTRNALRADLAATLRERANIHLDPDRLTLGFARRFATYKRGDLLFADPDRLYGLMRQTPFQILYAGKAHPRDGQGQDVLARVLRWAEDPRFRGHVHFVEDYDIAVGAALTAGVDVWVNTPRRPLEASGTSGQKVTLNLGLNLSVLDGWWLEGFDGENGWAIGDDAVRADGVMDEDDADALYAVLERELLPAWNDRDPAGLPLAWLRKVRQSTITCASRFNSHRMVRDYVQQVYKVSREPVPPVAAP